jgi:chloramphenicol 3-O phosphotransferase
VTPFQVVVLNGGSSAGKSTIARCLQSLLAEPWLSVGIDDFIAAMPPGLLGSPDGIQVSPDGQITVAPAVRDVEQAWMRGIAAMAQAGAGLILDLVFLEGEAGQQRWHVALDGLRVLWVGVRCDAQVASAREAVRGDRKLGMAATQANMVHRGVSYDLQVDSADASPIECARAIAERLLREA